jgi:hypothetical protein
LLCVPSSNGAETFLASRPFCSASRDVQDPACDTGANDQLRLGVLSLGGLFSDHIESGAKMAKWEADSFAYASFGMEFRGDEVSHS